MIDFEERLVALVRKYAVYDSERGYYCEKAALDLSQRQQIEASLIALFSHYLAQNGLEAGNIKKNSAQLSKYFHPDKFPSLPKNISAEVQWLEDVLSENQYECGFIKLSEDPRLLQFDDLKKIINNSDAVISYSGKLFYADQKTQKAAEIERVDRPDDLDELLTKCQDNYTLATAKELKLITFITGRTGQNDGATFKLIALCVDGLNKPRKSNQTPTPQTNTRRQTRFNFKKVSNIESLIELLEEYRKQSKTLTQRCLIDSIMSLLRSVDDYHNYMGKSAGSHRLLKTFINTMPYMTSGICIGFFADEMALLFAATYCVSKGGSWLEKNSKGRLKMLGQQVQRISTSISCMAAIILSRLVEFNFFILKNAGYLGIEAGSGLYYLVASTVSEKSAPSSKKTGETSAPKQEQAVPSNCNALALASQGLFGQKPFKHPEFQLTVMALSAYSAEQSQQWLSRYRQGHIKSALFDGVALQLRLIDSNSDPFPIKLEKAALVLKSLLTSKLLTKEGSQSWNAAYAAASIFQSISGQALPIKETALLQIDAAPAKKEKREKEAAIIVSNEEESMIFSH